MNYAQANEQLTGRCQQSRKLENNTYLQRRGKDIAVRLHATDVVTFHPNGDLTLNTGGWNTVTTWDRINRYARPLRMHNERQTPFLTVHGRIVPFADGMTVKTSGEIENGTKETIEDIRAEWRGEDRENARVARWKSKARGLVRDSSKCRKLSGTAGSVRYDSEPGKCTCWQCSRKGFRPSGLTYGECELCGCVGLYDPPACPKLTPAKIDAEENAVARRAMILCYGIARYLQDAGVVIEQSPEYTFLRKEIDRWNAVSGMRDAEGNLIIVDGQCRSLADALAWVTKTAADCLVNRGRGNTEDIIRAEMLRSL